MEFPFSVYIWHAPRKPTDEPRWEEVLRADSQQMAVYAATLLYNAGVPHQATIREHPVVKVETIPKRGLTVELLNHEAEIIGKESFCSVQMRMK